MLNITTGFKWYDIQLYVDSKGVFPGLDDVKAELKRPTVEQMLMLNPFVGKTFETTLEATKAGHDAQKIVPEIFNTCVRGIQGITIDDRPPTIEDCANEPGLVSFVWCVFNKLIEIGYMTKEEEKN